MHLLNTFTENVLSHLTPYQVETVVTTFFLDGETDTDRLSAQ